MRVELFWSYSGSILDTKVGQTTVQINIQHLLRKHNVAVFSSNYPLYGDLSNRVVQTLRHYAAEVEVYSIDEVFVRPVSVFGDLKSYGQQMRDAVWKQVRIPLGVGMASTKTLACSGFGAILLGVHKDSHSDQWSIRNLHERLDKLRGNPWVDYTGTAFNRKQKISKAMWKKLGLEAPNADQ